MARISCPKCKLSFSVKDTSRKSAECPDCGYRILLGGNTPPPVPQRQTQTALPPVPARKGGVPAFVIIGAVLAGFLVMGVVGAGVWYFGLRKTDKAQANPADTEPVAVEPTDPPAAKRLKITPTPKLEGNDVYKLLLPATVMIQSRAGTGSGVLICRDPNLIVTNHHVVGSFATVQVFFPEFTADGKVIREEKYYNENRARLAIRGRVLGRDPTKDVAVVEVDRVPENAQPVPMAEESAKELDRVYGIGASSIDLSSLWQAHEGSVRQILPPTEGFGRMYCRLMIAQLPTFHGDSGGPIVSTGVELVAIVQGGLPVKADVVKDKNGKPVILVEGREGMALNVDIEEIREYVHKVYRETFNGSFPDIAPLHEPGISPPPEGEDYSAADYVQILREGDPTQARAAVDRLIHLGAQSVPPLKDMLDDLKAAARWPQALLALEKIGEPASDATDVAAKRLTADNPAVRIGAVKYLAAMDHPARRHVPTMIQAANTNNPSVKIECEKAIIKLGPYGKADQAMIVGKEEDKDPNIRGLRARLLVELDISQTEKVALMDPFFKDPHPVVRADAVRAVCKPDKFPRNDVYRLVIPFLGDSDYSVRSAARDSLFNMGRVELADLDYLKQYFTSRSAEVHYYLLQRVRPIGERAAPIVPELSKSLNFPNDEVKFEAIQTVLAINRDLKSLTKDFIKLSTHENPLFRVRAMMCLRIIGKDENGVVAAMFDRLSDTGEVTQPPKDMSSLVSATLKEKKKQAKRYSDLPPINQEAPPVWSYAEKFLQDMRPFKAEADVREMAPFLKRDEKRSASAQLHAAEFILDAGSTARAAVKELHEALKDPKTVEVDIREALCRALGNCGPEASPAVRTLAGMAALKLDEDRSRSPGDPQRVLNQRVRTAALLALGRIGPGAKEALPELIRLADPQSDAFTQDEVIKTLGNLGSAAVEAVPNLMDLFLTATIQRRNLIINTIKKIGPGSLPPMVDFFPKYEKQWREKVGPFKDQIAKAKGCVECVIALGPANLLDVERKKLLDGLKSLRARAVIVRDKQFEGRLAEAITRVETAKK